MKNNQGFIGRIILLIIAVIALKYFLNFDIIDWFKSPEGQKIIQPLVIFLTNIYKWLDGFVKTIVAK
ncbi:MAG: hypothetical protein NTX96_02150 [Candidatus Zambryskibacteria bacterium]|nr:hypothetical protein [Candidatus Zambryskibacteria bacterium]